MGSMELGRFVHVTEKYNRTYGLHHYELNTGEIVSAASNNNWKDFVDMINYDELGQIVVSPELMTVVDIDFDCLVKNRSLIEYRINEILQLSIKLADKIFVLGTPIFLADRPHNAALIIRNGVIVETTVKRTGATRAENELFEMYPEATACLLPGTRIGVVICSDLAVASIIEPNSELLARTWELSGRLNLVGKQIDIIHPLAESIVALTCWAVGEKWYEKGQEDSYYQNQLRNIAWRIMRQSNVKEIVTVDRVPDESRDVICGPYNGKISL